MVERLKMKWEFIEHVEFKGAPSEEEIDLLYKRGEELAEKVLEWAGAETK